MCLLAGLAGLWRLSSAQRLPPAVPTLSPNPTVTASQVPGSEGALALYLLPRYLLINTLDVPIQYKQQARSASLAWLLLLLLLTRRMGPGWQAAVPPRSH